MLTGIKEFRDTSSFPPASYVWLSRLQLFVSLPLSFSQVLNFRPETSKSFVCDATQTPQRLAASAYHRTLSTTLRAIVFAWSRAYLHLGVWVFTISHRFQPFCRTCRDNKVGEPRVCRSAMPVFHAVFGDRHISSAEFDRWLAFFLVPALPCCR